MPGELGLVGIGLLYLGLCVETLWIRQLMDGYEGPTPPQIRSLLMTRLMIGAMSIVVIAGFLARMGV